ncbi:MAG: cyclic nucleotide-binding domain-containing protein [Candidatus Nitrohelix vancouverensis]|uniref:Cyclic nucleotide-binding domain-containing protein n=1 Tax=Candidatus Nitrohelix vancouverensis TaxID=2705534 RepID=A0A7T0C115_9BACT|nr:MAG: cyclic nucleotide-binding domain-containing protein [Candidatus Nitrohelix vancouverensis]
MAHKIKFKDLDKEIETEEGISVLEAAEEGGIDIPSSCRKGECGTCKVRKVSGEVHSSVEGTLSDDDVKNGYFLSCVAEATTDLVCVSSEGDEELQARVESIYDRTVDSKSFQLKATADEFYQFQPGQFITIGPVVSGKKQFRCYSISSSCQNKDHVEITVKRQKKGLVSNYFNDSVQVGDLISVKKPSGKFKMDLSETTDLLLVGSGSGITPLLSMVRSLTDMNSTRKIVLLYGNRTSDDIIFYKELKELETANPNFKLEVFLSQPDESWQGKTGRINPAAIIDAINAMSENVSLYTCGPGPVMEMAVETAASCGVNPERLHMEAFAPPKEKVPDNFLTLERLRSIDIFKGLSDKVLESMQPHIMFRRFLPGEMVIREGDFGNSAFYILEGNVDVYPPSLQLEIQDKRKRNKRSWWQRLKGIINKNTRGGEFVRAQDYRVSTTSFNTDGVFCDAAGNTLLPNFVPAPPLDDDGEEISKDKIIRLPKGEMFGELAALFRISRSATVAAGWEQSPLCETLEIKIQALRILSKRSKEFKSFIEDRYRERMLSRFVEEEPLFQGCSPELLERISNEVEFFSFRPKEVLLSEGQDNDSLYILLSGFAKLSKQVGEKDFNFHALQKGEIYGVVSLMEGKNNACTVTAINNVEAIALNRSIFEELLREPTASELIMKTVEARMKKMANIEEHIASLSLLSFGIENELPNGQSIMVINLDRCTRCDDCVKACADAHDGYPRFAREGRKIGNAMFPHACMHCIDPLCMDGCPSGALHRSKQHGEVLIDIDTCVGCTMCVTKCIYDNIVALPVAETVMMDADPVYQLNPANNKPVLKSMKCDLCVETGDPACVRSCPQDAMRRMSFNEIFESAY